MITLLSKNDRIDIIDSLSTGFLEFDKIKDIDYSRYIAPKKVDIKNVNLFKIVNINAFDVSGKNKVAYTENTEDTEKVAHVNDSTYTDTN